MNSTKQILFSFFIALSILLLWNNFYSPKQENIIKTSSSQNLIESRSIALQLKDQQKSVFIETDGIVGEISNNRFDNITLKKYFTTINKDESIHFLSPSNFIESNFIEFGWHSKDTNVPDHNNWNIVNNDISNNGNIIMNYINDQRVEFKIIITIDSEYMLNIEQQVINHADKKINLQLYTLCNKNLSEEDKNSGIHNGMIGVINDSLEEENYDAIKKEKRKIINKVDIDWCGLTNKYWLEAIIPEKKYQLLTQNNVVENNLLFDLGIRYLQVNNQYDKFQVDYTTPNIIVLPEQTMIHKSKLFLGPKQMSLLDSHAENIKLFDRAIDFGWLHIITKPLLKFLVFLQSQFVNFGVSILVMTLIIKAILFIFNRKSNQSMKKMQTLQPKLDQIKKNYQHDAVIMQKKVFELYKKEGVNPLSSIGTLLLQLPIMFGLYKVLSVSIEMRHASFIWWMQDLSSHDTTNIFNLCGLIPYELPSFIQLGVLPCLVAFTFYLQQKFSMTNMNSQMSQIMQYLPIVLLFVFKNMPVGLLLYWLFGNIFSILEKILVK